MSRPLTKQQQIVYDFIRDKIVSRGYGPTVREIGEYMNIKSPNGVMCHLRALERKGMILRRANKSRAIELTEAVNRSTGVTLTIAGTLTDHDCRLHLDASQVPDGSQPAASSQSAPTAHSADVPQALEPPSFDLGKLGQEDQFAIQVTDDSLLTEHICAGDLLVIQRQTSANHGQLVVLRIAESQTCMAKAEIADGISRFKPTNPSLPPTFSELAQVLGVAVGVVRDLQADAPAPQPTVSV